MAEEKNFTIKIKNRSSTNTPYVFIQYSDITEAEVAEEFHKEVYAVCKDIERVSLFSTVHGIHQETSIYLNEAQLLDIWLEKLILEVG